MLAIIIKEIRFIEGKNGKVKKISSSYHVTISILGFGMSFQAFK